MLDAATIRRLADMHLDRLAVIDGGGSERIVDKMPENYLYLGLLAILFPQAVFIHCRRDLRDVAVSCWMTDFTSIRWANDPAHIAARFQQYRRRDGSLADGAARADPSGGLREYRGRPRIGRAADWWRRAASSGNRPASTSIEPNGQSGRRASRRSASPFIRDSVARWKNYESALATLFAALPTVCERPPKCD